MRFKIIICLATIFWHYAHFERKIWHGRIVEDPNKYPFVGRLVMRRTDSAGSYFTGYCTGVYISAHWFVSASSCNTNETREAYFCMGITYMINHRCTYKRNITDLKIFSELHVKFFKLLSPFILSDNIQNAPLIAKGKTEKLQNEECVAVGWGQTEQGVKSHTLRETNFNALGFCIDEYPNMFCVEATNTNTCAGDAGGALIHNASVVGILVGGSGVKCGESAETYESYYTAIDALRDIIDGLEPKLTKTNLMSACNSTFNSIVVIVTVMFTLYCNVTFHF